MVFFAINILLTDLIEVTDKIFNDTHTFIQLGFTSVVVLIFVLLKLVVPLSQIMQLVSQMLIVLLIVSKSLYFQLQICDELIFM